MPAESRPGTYRQHSIAHHSRKRNIKFRKGLVGRLMGKYSGREGVVEGEEGEEEVHQCGHQLVCFDKGV
jgi:hypothetical protein